MVAAVVIVVSILVVFTLEKFGVTNFYSVKPQTVETDDAKTTSTAPSAQEDFTDGSNREISRNEKNEGQVQDTSGNVASIPSQDQWSVSPNGAITVYSPAKSSIIKSGDLLSGSSSLPKVYYRLIDNVSGVIAQGSLSVINGKFSGNFNFTTTGTSGRLDIYNADADGVESSNIEIPIRF